jgi:hypothetical protein
MAHTAGFPGTQRAITIWQALIVAAMTFVLVFFAAGYFHPASRASAQAPLTPGAITADAAATHIGQTETVEGMVSDVHTARSGSATFIDMGGPYPVNTFTGVIFPDAAATVGDVSGLEGRTVDLTGTVRLYRGKPEIILQSARQIAVR